MHRHVRRVGDQVAVGVEQRAGEVQPLLDVHRVGGVLQPQAHLLGDVHEQVVEDLEHHRDRPAVPIARCASARGTTRSSTRWSSAVTLRAPAGLDHRRRVRLGDDRRAVDDVARRAVARARYERRVVPARRRCTCAPSRAGAAPRACGDAAALGGRLAGADAPRPTPPRRSGALPGIRKEKRLRYAASKRGLHARRRAERHDQRRVGALVAQVHAPAHAAPLARRHALRDELVAPPRPRARSSAASSAAQASSSGASTACLAHRDLVGEAHAVGRQHAGERMDEDARHAERVGDQAGVLAAGAAEAAAACSCVTS